MLSIISTSSAEVSHATTLSTALQDDKQNTAQSLVDDMTAAPPADDQLDSTRRSAGDPTPSLSTPCAEAMTLRLQSVLGAVLEIEQLSRRAREAAEADDDSD